MLVNFGLRLVIMTTSCWYDSVDVDLNGALDKYMAASVAAQVRLSCSQTQVSHWCCWFFGNETTFLHDETSYSCQIHHLLLDHGRSCSFGCDATSPSKASWNCRISSSFAVFFPSLKFVSLMLIDPRRNSCFHTTNTASGEQFEPSAHWEMRDSIVCEIQEDHNY